MKKIFVIIAAAIIAVLIIISTCSCNKMVDTTYAFDRCVISLPSGYTVEGKVDGWTDFEDGDQLQVKIDGKTYLTHSTNVVLIAE